MESIRLSFPYGDTGEVCVHVTDSDGDAIDLAPFAEITFTVKRSMQDDDSAAVFQGTLTGGALALLTPTEDGIFKATVPAARAALMMLARPYYWTAKLTSGTGAVSTPVYGTLYADSPL